MSGGLNPGVIGTGTIARTMAVALQNARTGRLVAVASRHQETADKFGRDFHIPIDKRHCSYEALLAGKEVQAVYIATPHPPHAALCPTSCRGRQACAGRKADSTQRVTNPGRLSRQQPGMMCC